MIVEDDINRSTDIKTIALFKRLARNNIANQLLMFKLVTTTNLTKTKRVIVLPFATYCNIVVLPFASYHNFIFTTP
jgi:hypothetical protein